MSGKTFQFDQTLHGYDDGHRLLTASRKFPPDTERLMLILSDMSGTSMIQGFENYLTGYPLREINCYALARTWYAPEMKRPGCVWTHTIIISNADLAHLDPLALQNSFVRPTADATTWTEYSRYCFAGDLSSENLSSRNLRLFSQQFVQSSLGALYNSPNSQVFLSGKRISDEIETLTLAIWGQQWARLRRAFLFCTGAIASRPFPDRNFDWQVVPQSVVPEIKRENPNAVFVEEDLIFNSVQYSERKLWVKTAAEDLYESASTGLRTFLRLFGAEKKRGRADFAPLAQVYALCEQVKRRSSSISEFTAFIASTYPTADKGKRLKRAFYGAANKAGESTMSLSFDVDEFILLDELAQTEHYAAFDSEDLEIAQRAAVLTEKDFNASGRIAHSILENARPTPLAEDFLDGFCQRVTAAEAIDLFTDNFSVIFPIIKRKPSLLAEATLWQTNEQNQRDLFDYVRRYLNPDDSLVSLVTGAMLQAGSDCVADEIAYHYPKIAIDSVLSWCDMLPVKDCLNIGGRWKSILPQHEYLAIDWLRSFSPNNLSSYILLALCLNPHSYEVHRGGTELWLELARRAEEIPQDNVYFAAMTFLLVLGFDAPDKSAAKLVVESFEPIHSAAEENWLNEYNWNLLARQAPTVSWGGDWNKCERLRNALVEKFERYDWSREEFLVCLQNPRLLEKVVLQIQGQGRWFNSLRKYIEKTAKKVFESKVAASDEQKQVLHRLLD